MTYAGVHESCNESPNVGMALRTSDLVPYLDLDKTNKQKLEKIDKEIWTQYNDTMDLLIFRCDNSIMVQFIYLKKL